MLISGMSRMVVLRADIYDSCISTGSMFDTEVNHYLGRSLNRKQ